MTSKTLYPGVALITGAAGTGIGAAVARAFVTEGCKSIAITDRNAELLKATEQAILELQPGQDDDDDQGVVAVLARAGDIADAAFVQSLVNEVVATFGRLDYAVNCAGVPGTGQRCTETSFEDFDRINAINYRGVWLCSRAELGAMIKQEPLETNVSGRAPARGAIVNIASQLGIVSKAKMGPYSASKAAVISLTRSDAIDYAKDGIRVNCVCPGVIETPMTAWDDESRRRQEPFVQMAPVGRIGQPDEVADAALFLCSAKASFVQGHAMVVDGGYILT
ncbi:hypothetical protein G7054_g389 [Neopestalotiopsis clavispora]|nr:hypothetical protein G7054_g389 [Neopestalotiopsis clavispora]